MSLASQAGVLVALFATVCVFAALDYRTHCRRVDTDKEYRP